MPTDEVKDDIRTLAGLYMLQAGIAAGDRVDAGKVQDLLEAFGRHLRPNGRTGETFWVDGVVAVRDNQPYVILHTDSGPVVQLDTAQARQVAADIMQKAARVESDAVMARFLGKLEIPPQAINVVMRDLREFRKELDEAPTAEKRV